MIKQLTFLLFLYHVDREPIYSEMLLINKQAVRKTFNNVVKSFVNNTVSHKKYELIESCFLYGTRCAGVHVGNIEFLLPILILL